MSDKLIFDGRAMLVTGAAGALGSALTRQLVDSGAVVIMLDRRLAELEALYDELEPAAAHTPVIVETDFTEFDEATGDALAHQLSSNFSHLDALIHCANFIAPLTPIDHSRVKDIDKHIAVNLRAPWLITRACVPLMQSEQSLASRRSIIFSLADIDQTHKAFWSTWVTANGVRGLIPVLADELENRGVDVFGVVPGEFHSAWQTTVFPGRKLSADWSAASAAKFYVDLLNRDKTPGVGVTSGASIDAIARPV